MKNLISVPKTDIPKTGRDQTLDILKGIGIILMVIGHSGTPFADYIYLFHMALFFMASGYVWNDKKVADLPTLGKSLLSRFKSLWVPYFLANASFTLLNNVFVAIGFYPQNKLMALPKIAKTLFENIFMTGDAQFGGASWFLRCMLFFSIGHMILRYIVTRWKHGKILFGLAVVLALAGAEVINRTHWKFPLNLHTCFCGYTAFLMGMALRKLDLANKLKKYILLVSLGSFLILCILNRIDNIGLGVGNISSLPFFILASLSGWFLIWGVATLARGFVAKILVYCGKNAIWIVMLHFIAFKPVAWLYLTITGKSMNGLSAFPVYAIKGLWPAYALVGTALPLLLCAAVQYIRRLRKKP